MTARFNWIMLALLVLIGVPYWWLLVDDPRGDAPTRSLPIAELRGLAASLPGPAPTAVEVEQVAMRRVPHTLLVAGGGLRGFEVAVAAYRLPVPGRGAIVIDGGLTAAQADTLGMARFDAAAQRRVDAALRRAALVLVTHEHVDHLGGVLAAGPVALAAARLNAGQVPPASLAAQLPWPGGVRTGPPLPGGAPFAVAPGVVVIPAPGHTPGSQMIFVRLADGAELLFAGDIATAVSSWRLGRARSRLIARFVAPEDRAAVHGWLDTIRALKREAPYLLIVPGHDRALLREAIAARRLHAKFRTR